MMKSVCTPSDLILGTKKPTVLGQSVKTVFITVKFYKAQGY